MAQPIKTLIIHDWLVGMRGGEAVLEAILELFENPLLYTLIYKPASVSPFIQSHTVFTSFLQKIPGIYTYYPYFLPIMPFIIEHATLPSADLIISSSHCVAKGIQPFSSIPHISYIHAPMRYIWDRFDDYFGSHGFKRHVARLFRKKLQKWDIKSSKQPQLLIANSHYIAHQIKKYYQRTAVVIHPFCDLTRFTMQSTKKDYYLIVSALVPYKRIDIAIHAFCTLQKPLFIIGKGPEQNKLQKQARHQPHIQFLSHVHNNELTAFYQNAKALIFPGIEDFGITPLEALACGTPVIGLKQGGLLETITEETGQFFEEQTAQSCIHAIQNFEKKSFSAEKCRKRAELFSKKAFQEKFLEQILLFQKNGAADRT